MRKRFRECFALEGVFASSLLPTVVASVGFGITGCSETLDVSIKSPPPPGLVASGSATASAISASSVGSVASASEHVTWVSALPGTFPDAITISIRNLTLGDQPTDLSILPDGGFDPVAVTGNEGDQLELRIHQVDGHVTSFLLTVPAGRPPVVVRTRPPKGRTDVALSVRPIVVFSEPIDPATLTSASVQLLQHDTPVAGTVALVPESPFTAQFVPDSPLAPSTTYELVVTPEIRDHDGDPLEAEIRVPFTTVSALRDKIVFVSGGSSPDNDNEIFVMNTDGSGLVNLTNHPAADDDAAVSPDGSRILFATNRDGNYEIYVMDANGSGLVNLTNHSGPDRDPVWSPDGTMIAFASDRGGTGFDIFVMGADGSNPVNLTNSPTWARARGPTWSPDGTRIAFGRAVADTPECPLCSNVFVMNADGSNAVKLTDFEGPTNGGWSPAWSPDGMKIAFTGGPGVIWVMNADGSNPVDLSAAAGLVIPARFTSWSPDGSRIAFTMVAAPCELCGTDNFDVFVMNADGTNRVDMSNRPAVRDGIGSQAWSP